MASRTTSWAFPAEMQPSRDRTAYDLDAALGAMVQLSVQIPDEAYTAGILGTERQGYGCVIADDGLILTIGYVITEAQTIWITDHRGQTFPGHALAVDFPSGLGLVVPAMPMRIHPLARGRAGDVAIGDELVVMGHGGSAHALTTHLVARETFAGYWEYVLDDAIYTAPAHPQWGGSAVVDAQGRLVGIGSLLVQQQTADAKDGDSRVNMSVPVELLEPVLDDLRRHGRTDQRPRPWLGVFVQEHEGRLVVGGLTTRGPAARAGIEPGDEIDAVAGQRVDSLADLFRRIWAQGPAGTAIELSVSREGEHRNLAVTSIDRDSILWRPKGLN